MTYEDFRGMQNKIDNTLHDLGAELKAYPRNAMGLTLDDDKDARYARLMRQVEACRYSARLLNGKYCTQFKKEIRAEIDANRAARLAANVTA